MKKSKPVILFVSFLFLSPVWSQVSPEVLPDGRVTFRIKAPNADNVTVHGQWSGDPVVLAKSGEALWEGTTPEKVAPGVHEYNFMVDGMGTIDSRNRVIKPQRWPSRSILHIPSDPPAHWDLQDIPHGTVHLHDYYSSSLNTWRKLVVYTPPGLEKSKNRLPVLYLSHGHSDTQDTWTVDGKAHWIMDSLIHQKLAKPMIIVMPDAHPLSPDSMPRGQYGEANRQAFAREMVEEIIPFVEAHYKADKRPSMRAFAGLSMGGGHAFELAFQHHDQFSWIAAFSSSPPKPEYLQASANIKSMNKDLKLFWIACGDKDRLLERNEEADVLMEELGIHHEYTVTVGDDHSWPVWRRYLVTVLPRFFQDPL